LSGGLPSTIPSRGSDIGGLLPGLGLDQPCHPPDRSTKARRRIPTSRLLRIRSRKSGAGGLQTADHPRRIIAIAPNSTDQRRVVPGGNSHSSTKAPTQSMLHPNPSAPTPPSRPAPPKGPGAATLLRAPRSRRIKQGGEAPGGQSLDRQKPRTGWASRASSRVRLAKRWDSGSLSWPGEHGGAQGLPAEARRIKQGLNGRRGGPIQGRPSVLQQAHDWIELLRPASRPTAAARRLRSRSASRPGTMDHAPRAAKPIPWSARAASPPAPRRSWNDPG